MYVSVNPSTHTSIYIYTNVPCFDWKRPCFGGKTKDKWVPYIYIFIIIYTYEQNHMSICLVQASPHDAIDTSESLRI